MAQEQREYIGHCVNILDTFDSTSIATEEHFSRYLSSLQNIDSTKAAFIEEVFSGCVRYSQVIQIILNGFYVRDGKRSLRSEQNIYKVFGYLSLFRLDELGMVHFKKLVRSQQVHKMYKFLNFLFDEKNLLTWMRDEWNKLYETRFVQSTLLAPLIGWLPELREMLQQMKETIENNNSPKKPQVKKTEIKAFNLTKPRARTVAMPDPIPKLKRHREVPETTYNEPRESDFMSSVRETNRRHAEERLMEASKIQFACANPEKSDKTKRIINDIVANEDAKLDFDRHKSNPLPSNMLTENIPIRLNAATILREGKLYKKKEAEDLKKIEDLEAGAGDPSQFLDWQTRMRKQDMDDQMATIEMRRLEGKLSLEEAILARGKIVQENKQRVYEMKEEAALMMKTFLDNKLKEELEMRNLVETVMSGHENAKEAKRKLQEYKAKLVQEVNDESKELMKRALEEAEAEMKQRMELIHQIRAMEAVPVIRQKLVDFSETAGHGLLGEMSIAELRERMAILKVADNENEEQKRDDILSMKQAKERMLMETLETISRHRTEQSRAASNKQENHKTTRHLKPKVNDPKLDELQRRLEEKRAERLRVQEESRLIPDRKSATRIKELSSAKKSGEQARWEELEQRHQRTAKISSQGVVGSISASKMASRNRAMIT